jgi:protein-disulfide isomerase
MAYFDRDHPTFLAEPVSPADHIRGAAEPSSATVTLVEFGDFACPSCGESYGLIKSLLARRPDLRFVFRANPRSHLFPHAEIAAEAAEAAGAQGRFWEMHDLIYRRDQELEPALLRKFAKSIGIDLARFDGDLANDNHLRHVMEDFQSGVDSGVNGTPTFFINAERLDWDFETATLEQALERASSSSR